MRRVQASRRVQGLAPGGRAVAMTAVVPTAFLWGWGLRGRWPPAGRTHRTRGPVQRTAFLDHLPRNGHPLGVTFNPTGPIGTPAFQLKKILSFLFFFVFVFFKSLVSRISFKGPQDWADHIGDLLRVIFSGGHGSEPGGWCL